MGLFDDVVVSETPRRMLGRRSVIKAGVHAAWMVPTIQAITAAPAFASCSTPTPIAEALSFSVSATWVAQSKKSFYLRLIFTVCNSDCTKALTKLAVSVTARNAEGGLQEHSTRNKDENPGSMWFPDGGDDGYTRAYTSTYEAPKNGCTTITSAIQVRAKSSADNTFTGPMTITVTSNEGATSTQTVPVPPHP